MFAEESLVNLLRVSPRLLLDTMEILLKNSANLKKNYLQDLSWHAAISVF